MLQPHYKTVQYFYILSLTIIREDYVNHLCSRVGNIVSNARTT